MKRYNRYIVSYGNKTLVNEFISKSNGSPVRLYKHSDYKIESISLKDYEANQSKIINIYIDHFI